MATDPFRQEIIQHLGDFWCPKCSSQHMNPIGVATETGAHCPRCGTLMEVAGTGDDDPYPDDPDWRDDE